MALPPENIPPAQGKNAARDAAQQDVFLREVDDALRQDQFEGFFKTYGKQALAVIGAGLAVFGGWLYWEHRQQQAAEEATESYVQALDSLQAGNLADATSRLTPLAADGSGGTASASRLLLAGIALEQGKPADAVKLYQQVAADEKAPQPLRDLALVREVGAQFDSMKPEDVVSKLKPLAAPGNPWFGVAGELVGMAYLKQGKPAQAAPLFAAIAKDDQVSEGLRSRARQLAAVLGADAVDDVVDERGEPLAKAGFVLPKPASDTGAE